MKKLVYSIALVILAIGVSFAQYEPKGKVNRAERFLESKELNKAKAEVDMAFEVNKKGRVKDKAKNWYTRGRVYKSIFLDSGQYHSLDDEALSKAVNSFEKTKELEDNENGVYTVYCDNELNQLYGVILNQGANLYNANDYPGAYKAFDQALMVFPKDTTALLYAGTAAQQAEMFDESIDAYTKLVKTGNANKDVYKALIYLNRNKKKDIDATLKILDEAIQKFPEDDVFTQEKITMLITEGRSEHAEKEIKKEIEKNPENEILYYELGFLYDELNENDKALKAYESAIDLKPDYYEALFNAGAIYYNKGVDIIKELNELPMKEYTKKEEEYNKRWKAEFEKALPYFEKAYELKSDELSLIETLAGVYIRMGMKEKAAPLEKKIQNMTGEEMKLEEGGVEKDSSSAGGNKSDG